MIDVNAKSPVPIFEQIKLGLRGQVAKGFLKPGDQVPGIRSMAEKLSVNPNTISRAYRELILEGFLESRRGEGHFVSQKGHHHATDGLEQARKQLKESILLSRRAGLTWKDIREVLLTAKREEVKDYMAK
jgi:GntR family transcriptional regulator